MRLFVAINLPVEVAEKIQHWQNHWKRYFPASGVKWVKASNIHLTLSFLGETSEADEKNITDKLSAIDFCDKLSLRITGVGFFPDTKSPRVFYLEVTDRENNLFLLAEKVRQACAAAIPPCDDKPFRPHLTLARFKTKPGRPPNPEELWQSVGTQDDTGWQPTEIALMASELTASGPLYTVRRTFKLKK